MVRTNKNGEVIEKYGKKWTVLDTEFKTADGKAGTLLLAADIWDHLPFDEEDSNYYPETSICSYLKEETKRLIGDEETGTVSLPMTAEDGTGWEHEPYQTNGLFLLTTDMYRKYRRYIPKMPNWWWTATAGFFNGSKHSGNSYYVRCVGTDGTLSIGNVCYGDVGLVPALVIF